MREAKEILKNIIHDFSSEKFIRFFREKNPHFIEKQESLSHYDDNDFTNINLLGEINLKDGEQIIVCTFKVQTSLTERSGKKAQYEKAKKILKDYNRYSAGIFIFYDSNGNFRFSLVYPEYTGSKRKWSYYKRFTFFVSPSLTNKTFLKQIGDGDFSSLKNIKDAFSVEPVTKQFYEEIQNWYFWAMDKIKFPDDYKYSDDPIKDKEIRNSINLIRLITRIIFVWFLKEKNLIPDILFSQDDLKNIVKDFLKDKSASSYYNAILQNLFFGTLNRDMNDRHFTEEGDFKTNKKEYGVKNLYRYRNKFLISENEVLNLFKSIPFLNGGLFDCLDKETSDERKKIIYVDGFSRNPKKQAIIPDFLFFQKEEEKIDLSQYELGKNKPVRGLTEILKTYNFTIDENTPVDQEIALDPELLGRVFENLLASYNPETRTTARKATGSYYTPREIVDYMVTESLFQYLKTKFPDIDDEKLRMLLSYSDEIPEFTDSEKKNIIEAIANIKILDPACGSGAFPMGILHKAVYILQRLDAENKYWYELQYQKALKATESIFKDEDKKRREEMLKEINETFDENINYPDYARKLYLIENCIYGVDIQPIAIQISKLRFFISLLLDQKVDKTKENFGIRPLPNLETKFVSANTLIGIEKPEHLFYTPEIKDIEDELKRIRHKYFQAKTRQEKIKYQEEDKKLREKLAQSLRSIGYSIEASKKIAEFDLFDQNASTDWFDAEWMFGVTDGFDIVIANPPYIRQEKIRNLKPILNKQGYEVFNATSDIYTYFYEKGYQILKESGILCFISSNKWMRAKYGEKLRKFFKEKVKLIKIIDFNGYKVFEATVDTNIIIFQKINFENNIIEAINIKPDFLKDTNLQKYVENNKMKINQDLFDVNCFIIADEKIIKLKEKIEKKGIPLKDWEVKIYRGITTGLNEAFIITNEKRDEILKNCKTDDEKERTEKIIKPILRGRDIGKYYYKWDGLWVITTFPSKRLSIENYPALKKYFLDNFDIRQLEQSGKKYPELGFNARKKTGNKWFEIQDNTAYYPEFEKEKIVWQEIVREPSFAYDNKKFYCDATSFIMTGKYLKYLITILNSKPATLFFKQFYAGGGLGEEGYRYKKAFLEQLPIPKISDSEQKPFIEIVDKILEITKDEDYPDNPTKQAKVKEYEHQIDLMVYKLYNLTDDEIKIIEGESLMCNEEI